jgi:hypothetical protein
MHRPVNAGRWMWRGFPLVVAALAACSHESSSSPPDDAGDAGRDGGGHPDGGAALDSTLSSEAASPGDSATQDTAATLDGGPNPRATFGGCPLFAPDYAYNVDISAASVDPASATYIASLTSLAPDIAAEFPGGEYYNIVPSTQAGVPVQAASAFGFEATDGGFFFYPDGGVTGPIPPGVVYENMTTPNADHHMMVLEQGACLLYELYAENPSSATTGWDVFIQWNLHGSPQIPDPLDIGSTTQAGTPLLPGIIWPTDVAAGEIHHAIDIVMADNAIMPCSYVHPASTVRYSGAPAGEGIPYGARLRLKSTFDSSGFTGTQALVVVQALQRFGMIPTDASGESRSVFRLGQSPDGGTLDQSDMSQLNVLTWSDFDVITLGTVIHPAGCMP